MKIQHGAASYGPEDVYNLPDDPVVMRSSSARATVMGGIYMIVLSWVCTEVMAARLHFDPLLGKPEFAHIYDPYMVFAWMLQFSSVHFRGASAAAYVHNTMFLVFVLFLFGFAGVWYLGYCHFVNFVKTSSRPPDLRGSMHWATPSELKDMGLLPK